MGKSFGRSITLSEPKLSTAQTGEWTRDNRLNDGRYQRVDRVKINQINGTIVNQSRKNQISVYRHHSTRVLQDDRPFFSRLSLISAVVYSAVTARRFVEGVRDSHGRLKKKH